MQPSLKTGTQKEEGGEFSPVSSSSRVWSVFLAKNGSTGRQWNDGGLRVSREMRVIRKATTRDRDSSRNVRGQKKTINGQPLRFYSTFITQSFHLSFPCPNRDFIDIMTKMTDMELLIKF